MNQFYGSIKLNLTEYRILQFRLYRFRFSSIVRMLVSDNFMKLFRSLIINFTCIYFQLLNVASTTKTLSHTYGMIVQMFDLLIFLPTDFRLFEVFPSRMYCILHETFN